MSDPANLEIGRPADEAELRAYRRLASQAFSAQPSNQQDVSRLIEQGRLDTFRVARQDGVLSRLQLSS